MRGRVKGVTTDFVPHTDEDVRAMLAAVGVASVDDLFADIPKALRLGRALDLGDVDRWGCLKSSYEPQAGRAHSDQRLSVRTMSEPIAR